MPDRWNESILSVCEKLHGEICGSGEGAYPSWNLMRRDVEWLQMQISQWVENKTYQSYDTIIKILMLQTISDTRNFLKNREEK